MTASAIAGVRRGIRELVDGTLRVQVDIEPLHRKAFFELFPDIDMPVALAPLNVHESAVSTAGEQTSAVNRAPNELARQMHVDGYFRNRKLWLAMHDNGIYTLAQHKAWVENQKCCVIYIWDRFPDARRTACEGEVCAHHTDGAELPAAGLRQRDAPQKPPHFYTVPICHKHHREWAHGNATREHKRVLLEYAVELTAAQVKAAMKRYLKIESLREITAEMLAVFHTRIGL